MTTLYCKAPRVTEVQVPIAQCFQTSCTSPLQSVLAFHIACVRSANERQDLLVRGIKTMQSAETLVPVAEHVCLPKFLKKGSVCISNGHSDVSFQELISLAQNFPSGGALTLSALLAVSSDPRQGLACNLKETQYNHFCTDRPACRTQRC